MGAESTDGAADLKKNINTKKGLSILYFFFKFFMSKNDKKTFDNFYS